MALGIWHLALALVSQGNFDSSPGFERAQLSKAAEKSGFRDVRVELAFRLASKPFVVGVSRLQPTTPFVFADFFQQTVKPAQFFLGGA